jgi:large subunit ribosomal protein L29
MKTDELRELTVDSLKKKVSELEAEHFNLRFQAEMGQLENPIKLRDTRKAIARTKTILTEKLSA